MSTRIMTYNVHSCVGVDDRLDVARIAAVIAQSKPDIVALQELDVGRIRTGGVDQAHAIASRLGMSFHFGCAMTVAEEQYGDAILTALPMRLVKAGPLPTLPRVRGLEPRGAIWAAIEVEPGVEVQIVNTHLGLVPLEQRAQAATLVGPAWLGDKACAAPKILIGDFNATSRYACYKVLTKGMADAQRQLQRNGVRPRTTRTFPSRFPMLRIDHLFVSPGVEVLDVHAPNGPLTRAASDHLPLVADFRVSRPG
ncbi:MAG TPA: endonuclease/exonuclease/phosphatase family protein [Caulobacteraceae bacterium]|jgi:endonuclease/exonuclease/phosphatase family metal-dependent hydrolase|nr:endonuclease/exonuclease/phosphatase family protein [Caulobacteraceae bacterium]